VSGYFDNLALVPHRVKDSQENDVHLVHTRAKPFRSSPVTLGSPVCPPVETEPSVAVIEVLGNQKHKEQTPSKPWRASKATFEGRVTSFHLPAVDVASSALSRDCFAFSSSPKSCNRLLAGRTTCWASSPGTLPDGTTEQASPALAQLR